MKKPETKKAKNKIKITVIIICIILIGYFIFAFINSNIKNSNAVSTEIAKRYTYSETISADAFVVRNETLLNYSGSKVLYYTANDGDIVAAGSDVALVFSNEEAALNYNKYRELNSKIDELEKLNTSHNNVKMDYSAADKQIGINIINIISAVNSNSPANISSSADNLLYSINQRQIITGKVQNFDSRIAELKKEALKYSGATSKYIDKVTLDSSTTGGYFVASVDGFEKTYDYNSVSELTIDKLKKDLVPAEINSNTIGKIISGLNWYIVCELSADEALTLSHATESFTVSFYNTTCRNLPVTLVALNQNSKQSDAVAVFKCNYMNSAISHLRNEEVQITVNSCEGIKISKEALHNDYVTADDGTKRKVLGVYVAYGSKLEFKEISILYSGTDFVIADESPDEGILVSGQTVELNDEIVVKGENLYAGKNIEKH